MHSIQASEGTVHVATVMALAHNLMIRYLNSIYLQATGVRKHKDIADFLFYCQTWCGTIHEHHEGEETGFFPRIEEYSGEKGVMDQCVDEHHEFTAGIANFEKHVRDTKPEDYDGKQLREMIDSFAPALVRHLGAEILKLIEVGEKYGGEKIQTTFDKFEQELMKESRPKWDPVSILKINPNYCSRFNVMRSMLLFLLASVLWTTALKTASMRIGRRFHGLCH